jgi:dTDP-4-dehydrorhamnose reductase
VETIAIIGARGQLGVELVETLGRAPAYRVCPLSHTDMEVADPDSVRAAFTRVRPTVAINCAAFHRVDDCEDQPDDAMRVNAVGALHVARACNETGALCVYVSTDYVFGSAGAAPYGEDDQTGPMNLYGVSKLAGEQLVTHACSRSLIVRVAGMYGRAGSRARRGNFVDAVIAKARSGRPFTVIADVRVSPTYARDAAAALTGLIARNAGGIVHLTNTGSCTWHQFACRIVAAAGLEADVVPIPSSQHPATARRPRDSSLRSVRVPDLLGAPLRAWTEAVDAYVAERAPIA